MTEANKLTILIDMDDTIENLLEVWVKTLNKTYGTNVTLDMIRSWDIKSYFPELSRNQIFGMLDYKSFWNQLDPLPGAMQNIANLIMDGHNVYIVTASHHDTVAAKLKGFLFKYFPFISTDHVIIASHKQMIKGDVLVDDAPHNLIGGSYAKILKSAPHNRDFDESEYDIVRCDTWDEIYAEIQKIVKNKEVCNGSY